jgi:hypothetical protein
MNRLSKEDLAQMSRDYFQSLDKQKLVEVAGNLHSLAVEQLERLEQNSSNSSLPPTFNPDKTGQPLSLVWCLRSCFMAGQTAAPGQILTLNQ